MSQSPAYIEEVAVLQSHQGRGIGSELVVRACRRLHEQGYQSVTILPLNSSHWVERLGFSPWFHNGFIAPCHRFATPFGVT